MGLEIPLYEIFTTPIIIRVCRDLKKKNHGNFVTKKESKKKLSDSV